MRNVPHRLTRSNTLAPAVLFGKVLEPSGVVALLEEVCHWGGGLVKLL